MKLMQFIGAASVVSMLSLALAGTAAATDVGLNTTGPDSSNTVTTSNVTSSETTNTNNVSVENWNVQEATTGDVTAKDNTTVGSGAGSGTATNNSAATTVVNITNPSVAEPGLGGGTGTTPGTETPTAPGVGGGTSPGSGSGSPATPGKGGSVEGASTTAPGLGGGEEILPVTGPLVPVDVSALRAAWHPQTGTSPSSLVRHTSMFTAGMLGTAALLSLIGAVGSVMYARRKEQRV